MQKRKGFTLVELVIVIAVIAILAGVLIGTFASVINRANESTRLQEIKAQEIQQKADDILKKIEDSNWYGWEDFETSIVEKITAAYKQNANSVTTEDIKQAVSVAMKEYADSHANDKTSLTEDQVKAIIENALGTLTFEGVTEAQVKAIVSTATSDITAGQVSEAKIKEIVNAANENKLTAADVAKVAAESVKGLATTANVDTAVSSILSGINTATAGALSKQDVVDAILELVPVTYTIKSEDDLTKALASVVSFSTLDFTPAYANNVTITLDSTDTRTLTIAGAKLTKLTIDAPNANIYLTSEVEEVVVTAVASSSLHIKNKVTKLTVNSGRAVLEDGADVKTLDVVPSQNAVVEVEVRNGASVEDLNLQYQSHANSHDTIIVSSQGEVENVNLSGGSENTSTNLKLNGGVSLDELNIASNDTATYKVEEDGGLYTGTKDTDFTSTTEDVVVFVGAGTEADPYLIRNEQELFALSTYVNGADFATYMGSSSNDMKYYKITADIDIKGDTWVPLGNELGQKLKNISIDGGNHVINGLSNLASYQYRGTTTTSHSAKVSGQDYAFIKYVEEFVTIKNVKFTNVNINLKTGKYLACLIAESGEDIDQHKESTITITNVSVDGKIETGLLDGTAAGLIAYVKYAGYNGTNTPSYDKVQNIVISGCKLDVSLGAGQAVGAYIARNTSGAKVNITSSDTQVLRVVSGTNPTHKGVYVGRSMYNNVYVNGTKVDPWTQHMSIN